MMKLLGAIALLLLVGCSSSTGGPPTPTPHFPTLAPTAAGQPPPVAVRPVFVQGTGMGQSSTFSLGGGDYALKISGTSNTNIGVGCYNGLSLRASGGSYYEIIANDEVNDGPAHVTTNHLHGVPAGRYYVDASSGCSWAVTFTSE